MSLPVSGGRSACVDCRTTLLAVTWTATNGHGPSNGCQHQRAADGAAGDAAPHHPEVVNRPVLLRRQSRQSTVGVDDVRLAYALQHR